MKKLYNFRLETTLIKAVDKISNNRTEYLTNALQQSLQPNYNVDINYLQHLESEISFLRNQMQIQSERIFMLPAHEQKPITIHKKHFWNRLFS